MTSLPTRRYSALVPVAKQGLYDPANEHDACGVGFVAHLKGDASHSVVRKGIQVLVNLEHRGACGCDPETGDGAGVLIQIPDQLYREDLQREGVDLPDRGSYAVGMIFLSRDPAVAARQEAIVEALVREEGQAVVGWRDVPHNPAAIGIQAREGLPQIREIFVKASEQCLRDGDAFERKLYVIRRRVEKAVASSPDGRDFFYVPSFSSRTVAYVGMLISRQIDDFYPDLLDPRTSSALIIVHSR